MMEISDTPHGSISYACEIIGDLYYHALHSFPIISHANKRGNNCLISIRIIALFCIFILNFCDILERFGIDRSSELYYYLAGEFWSDATGDCESF